MACAAIEILASHGVAGLTHRLVAANARVSLAATTYYFSTKYEIVAEASDLTLRGYTESFRRAAERMRTDRADSKTFRRFLRRLIGNAASRDRTQTLAWAEIILDAHRRPESLALARNWFAELDPLWEEIVRAARIKQPARVGHSAIDLVIGLLFMTIALGLNEQQVDAALIGEGDPLKSWGDSLHMRVAQVPVVRSSSKSAETRERILSAAVDLLISDGVSAVTYRNIASKAALTVAAPAYHFATVGALLAAAQERLFAESKKRYREDLPTHEPLTLERLIDRTSTVFVREATQFAGKNLATYAIWLEAARNAELRPMVWSAINDQHLAWQRVLARVMPQQRPRDPLAAQATYIGKIIRVLATGSTMDQLAPVRTEFAYDMTALARGRHWF